MRANSDRKQIDKFHGADEQQRLRCVVAPTRLLWPALAMLLTGPCHAAMPESATSVQTGTEAGSTQPERENWRRAVNQAPPPGNGCFSLTFPETKWHEVPCGKPSHKLYLPRRAGTSTTNTVGGSGSDIVAKSPLQSPITRAFGSFDSVSGVTSATEGYSVQLNTNFFKTGTCGTNPDPNCKGFEQFVFDGNGGGKIQYWLVDFGPVGTVCPQPNGATCAPKKVFDDGWCPEAGPDPGFMSCAIDGKGAVDAMQAPAQPLSALGLLGVSGGAGIDAGKDFMTVTDGNVVTFARGDNHFPELGTEWLTAEFNVFGSSDGGAVSFNNGSTIDVRIGITNGTKEPPACSMGSTTAESNDLSLVRARTFLDLMPTIVITESNSVAETAKSCLDMTQIYKLLLLKR